MKFKIKKQKGKTSIFDDKGNGYYTSLQEVSLRPQHKREYERSPIKLTPRKDGEYSNEI